MSSRVNAGPAGFVYLCWMPFGVLLSSYAAVTMWHWFMVPLGLPVIGQAHAYGIGLLAHFLTHTRQKSDPDEDALDEAWQHVGYGFFVPLFTLLFGWIAHSMM